jgi:hypothetical protein
MKWCLICDFLDGLNIVLSMLAMVPMVVLMTVTSVMARDVRDNCRSMMTSMAVMSRDGRSDCDVDNSLDTVTAASNVCEVHDGFDDPDVRDGGDVRDV